MEVPPLLDLCIYKIAELSQTELPTSCALSNDMKLSLLNKLSTHNLPSGVLEQFSNATELREISLSSQEIVKIVCGPTRLKDLISLKLDFGTDRHLLEMKREMRALAGNNKYEFSCLFDLLNLLLERSSWRTLRHLKLDGCKLPLLSPSTFSIMPSLQQLEITAGNLEPGALRIICCSCQNLTHLILDFTTLRKLDGISNAENLKVLSLQGSIFKTSDDIREIFFCKKLEVLNIQTFLNNDLYCPNFISYIGCNDVLPELTSLNISLNTMTEVELERLIDGHKKLETISLIGTPLEFREQYEDRNIVLLTVRNIPECLNSLKNHENEVDVFCVKIILCALSHHLWTYTDDSEEILRECFDVLLSHPLSVQEWPDCRSETVSCLSELLKDNRVMILNPTQFQLYTDFLCRALNEKGAWDDHDEHMHSVIWKMLENNTIFRGFRDMYEMCKRAISEVKKSPIMYDGWLNCAPKNAMLFLHTCWKKDDCWNSPYFKIMLGDTDFQDRVWHYLDCLNSAEESIDEIYDTLFHFMQSAINRSYQTDICSNRVTNYAAALSRNLKRLIGVESKQTRIVSSIWYIVLTNNTIKTDYLFTEPTFSISMEMMRSRNPELRYQTFRLYVELYMISNQLDDASFERKVITIDELIQETLLYTSNVTLSLDLIEWLCSKDSPNIKNFAMWILEHYLEVGRKPDNQHYRLGKK